MKKNLSEHKQVFAFDDSIRRIPPRLLCRQNAAAYLGIGVTLFDGLVAAGLMPPPKALGTRRKGWDIHELDIAIDDLPHATESSIGNSDPYLDVA